jgi:hypothetical protein
MSSLVHTGKFGRKSVGLISQLSWVAVSAKTEAKISLIYRQKIRKIAALQSATHYVLLHSASGVFTGLYLPSVLQGHPKGGMHSVALVFLAWLQDLVKTEEIKSLSGILLLKGMFSSSHSAYVVIEEGNVLLDSVYDTVMAVEQIAKTLQTAPSTPVFINFDSDAILGWNCRKIDWDQLYPYVDASNQLQRVAAAWWMGSSTALIIVGVLGSLAYDELVVQPQKRAQLAYLAQANDRTPEYVLAFDKEAKMAGWDRSNLSTLLTDIKSQPIFVAGWALQEIECKLLSGEVKPQTQCIYSWRRVGGTLKAFELAIDPNIAQIDWRQSGIASLKTVRHYSLLPSYVSKAEIKNVLEVKKIAWTFAQYLENIQGMSVGFGEPKEWSGRDVTGVTTTALVQVVPVTLGVPLHQSLALLSEMAEGIFIKSLQINIDSVKVQFKGVMYAR